MRQRLLQASFASGIISKLVQGRSDLEKWGSGLAQCKNMIPLPQGPVTRRPGTIYAGSIKNGSTKAGRLITFRFSATQVVVIELTDQTMRFYENGELVESSPGTPYELATPYLEAELDQIDFAQFRDWMYIVHNNHAPRVLVRNSSASWTLSTVSLIDGPYDEINSTATTFTPSGTSGSVTVTASASTFASTDVGRLIRYRPDSSSDWGYATIASYNSATQVNATVSDNFPFTGTTASEDWRLSAWNNSLGWPGRVTIYEQRLAFARNTTKVNTIWFSASQAFSDTEVFFSPSTKSGTVGDAEAFEVTLGSTEFNIIEWLAPGTRLAVGTEGAEWVIQAGNQAEAFSPTNRRAIRSTGRGSISGVYPIEIDGYTLFAQRDGKTLREFSYSFDLDAYRSIDVTLLANGLFSSKGLGKIADIAYCQFPHSLVWVAMDDGRLLSFTYEPSQDLGGWAEHTLGGAFGEGDPVIESITSVYDDTLEYDQLWMIVKRTVNGATARYVEYFAPTYVNNSTISDAHFVDCAAVYTGSAITSHTGLTHLEGESVNAQINGAVAYENSEAVASGTLALPSAATTVRTGYTYESLIETLDVDGGSQLGSGRGAKKRNIRPQVYAIDTQYFRAGYRSSDTQAITTFNIPTRKVSDLMGSAPTQFTEWIDLYGVTPVQNESSIVLSTNLPGATTIGAIRYGSETFEG